MAGSRARLGILPPTRRHEATLDLGQGHVRAPARLLLVLVLALALSACEQPELPLEPEARGPALRPEFLNVYVGYPCPEFSSCLRDDLAGITATRAGARSGWIVGEVRIEAPASAGASMDASLCTKPEFPEDGPWWYCGPPGDWRLSLPDPANPRVLYTAWFPDDLGRWAWVQIEGSLRAIQLQAVGFERPDPAARACTVDAWGTTSCAGRIRAEVALSHIGWYLGKLDARVEGEPGRYYGVPDKDIHHRGGLGTSDPARFEVILEEGYRFPSTSGEPDPALVVRYRPYPGWEEGEEYLVRFPLWAEPVTLVVEADREEVEAPGDTVTFTARAEGATVLEVLEWQWLPEGVAAAQAATAGGTQSATSSGQTQACEAGVNPCRTGVFETGRMRVQARVDGVERQAESPRVRVGQARLKLECLPESVVRGTSITCTASTELEAASLDNIRWKFVGGGFERTSTTEGRVWAGPVAVSGEVTVTAKVNDIDQPASAQVRVKARDWNRKPFAFEAVEKPNDHLSEHPREVHHLGDIHFYDTVQVHPGAVDIIPTGPNYNLAYLREIPWTVRAVVHVNRQALSTGSDFWQAQRDARPAFGNQCAKADVVPFIAVVLRHEGIPPSDRSHSGLYKDKAEELAGPAAEGIVGDDYREMTDAAVAAIVCHRAGARQSRGSI